MIIDFAVGQDAVQKAGGVEIAQKIVTNELYGFAFAEDNDALREQVNAALAEIKQDGTLTRHLPEVLQEGSADIGAGRNPRAGVTARTS